MELEFGKVSFPGRIDTGMIMNDFIKSSSRYYNIECEKCNRLHFELIKSFLSVEFAFFDQETGL